MNGVERIDQQSLVERTIAIASTATAGAKETGRFRSALKNSSASATPEDFYHQSITKEQADELQELRGGYFDFVIHDSLKNFTVGNIVHNTMSVLYSYLKPDILFGLNIWIDPRYYNETHKSQIQQGLTILRILGIDAGRLRAFMSISRDFLILQPPLQVQDFLVSELEQMLQQNQ